MSDVPPNDERDLGGWQNEYGKSNSEASSKMPYSDELKQQNDAARLSNSQFAGSLKDLLTQPLQNVALILIAILLIVYGLKTVIDGGAVSEAVAVNV